MKNKSVLVTGSTKGIGLAIGKKFLAEGAKVAFNGRNPLQLRELVSSFSSSNAIGVDGDVTNPAKANAIVEQVISEFSALDVLVCNVGSGCSVPPGQETHQEWVSIFHQNLWSATNMIESAKKYLIKTKGCIICISSICGLESIPGAPLTYSVAKSALNTYVRGISRPLGLQGIRINAIAPGNIIFPGSIWEKKIRNDPDSVKSMLVHDVALSRLGTPEEIAKVALWLASSDSAFCTGSIFVADGGQTRCWK